MKKNAILILVVVMMVSTVSIVSMVKNTQQSSFNGIECNAQGDFMPEPFDNTQFSPMETNESFCSGQGDIKPSPWPVEEKEDEDETLI